MPWVEEGRELDASGRAGGKSLKAILETNGVGGALVPDGSGQAVGWSCVCGEPPPRNLSWSSGCWVLSSLLSQATSATTDHCNWPVCGWEVAFKVCSHLWRCGAGDEQRKLSCTSTGVKSEQAGSSRPLSASADTMPTQYSTYCTVRQALSSQHRLKTAHGPQRHIASTARAESEHDKCSVHCSVSDGRLGTCPILILRLSNVLYAI